MSWFSATFRQGFANLGGPALKRFDARALARRWKETGAELVYMDGIHQTETLFPTAISTMAPHLDGRDLVAEFTTACKELGLRSGAYITPFEHTPFSRNHPEFSQTDTAGKLVPGPNWAEGAPYWSCWNTPFLDRMCALIMEMFGKYDLDAAFFDGLLSRHGICRCPSCVVKFKADTGNELPAAVDLTNPVFREYLRWKDRTLVDACKRLVAATRVRNPGVQVVSNTPAAWCNWCAVQPVEFFDAAEFACCEVFPGFMDLKRLGFIHPSGVGSMAYMVAYTRGQSKDFPKVQCYSYAGNVNYSTDIDTMLEAKSIIAMGGLHCAAGYRAALKGAFDYTRRCEPYLIDTKPVLWCALPASQESCNTQHDLNSMGEAFFEDLGGAFALLLDAQVPVEFISGRGMAGGIPDSCAALLLSDVGFLTERQAAAIRSFVEQGGGLVVTHRSGLVGVDGKALGDFVLADVMGVHAVSQPPWEGVGGYMQEPSAACLCFADTPWWGDAAQAIAGAEYEAVMGDTPWMSSGRGFVLTSAFQAVSADTSAVVHAWIRSHADPKAAPLPGIVENRFGRGRVIYLAPRLGETYARYPLLLWRRLLRQALDRVAARPPPVELKAPLCVTAYAWEQQARSRWVIHLINDLDQAGRTRGRMCCGKNDMSGSRPREGAVPVGPVEVVVRKPGATRASLPLEGKELRARVTRDGMKIRLRNLDQHALIVVE